MRPAIPAMKVLSWFFLVTLVFLVTSSLSPAQVAVLIRVGPPPLPVYDQPICPGEGYLWTPGYWDWDQDAQEYYWVPGTWVMAPEPGLLWTPGYWAWDDGGYRWYPGYWAPQVGFYGGIDYGYGYPGEGFYGGKWQGNAYRYNTAVTNVNTTIVHNTYNTQVTNNYTTVNRVSFNGGSGGTTAKPTTADMAVARQAHRQPTPVQTQQQQSAKSNREFHVSMNGGNPPVAATPKPGVFHGPGVVPSRSSGNANEPPTRNARPEDRPSEANPNRSTPPPNANRPNPQPQPNTEPNTRERPNPNARPPENTRPPEKPQPRENPKNPPEKPTQPPPSNPREKPPESRPKPQEKPQEQHPNRPPEQKPKPPEQPPSGDQL